MAAVLIQVDGSARFNPGPAGVGVKVMAADGRTTKEISRFIGNRTNNQAEYEAMLLGLREAMEHAAEQVVIETDSALIYNQLLGRFKVKDSGLKPLHARCRELLARLPRITLRLVPREENKAADKLAQAASAAGAKPPDRTAEGSGSFPA